MTARALLAEWLANMDEWPELAWMREYRERVTAYLAQPDSEAAEIERLKHKVRALQMLIKGQHEPIDWKGFVRETDALFALDAARGEPRQQREG